MDDRWNDRTLCSDREHEWAFLERTQVIVLSARPLGIHNDRAAALDLLRGNFVRFEGGLSIVAIEKDDPCRFGSVSKQRDFPKLRFGDKAVARKRRGEDEDVEPADVVGDVDGTGLARDALRV